MVEPSPTSGGLFPKRLEDSQGPRLVETFGFARLSCGIFLLSAAIVSLLPTIARNDGSNSVVAIGAGILAGILLVRDTRRRRRRAVVVLDEERLAVYRNGRFSASVPLDQVAIDQIERLFARIMLAIFSVLVALVIFIVSIIERWATTTASLLLVCGIGLLGVFTVSSLVWTWFGCHRVLLQDKRGRARLLLIRPSATSNFFVRTLPTLNFACTVHRCYGSAKPSD